MTAPEQAATPRCDEMENAEAWRSPEKWITELSVAWGFARRLEGELQTALSAVEKLSNDWLHDAMERSDQIVTLTQQRDALLTALQDLVGVTHSAMDLANRDGAEFNIEEELRESRAAIAIATVKNAANPINSCSHKWARRRDGRRCADCGRIEFGTFV